MQSRTGVLRCGMNNVGDPMQEEDLMSGSDLRLTAEFTPGPGHGSRGRFALVLSACQKRRSAMPYIAFDLISSEILGLHILEGATSTENDGIPSRQPALRLRKRCSAAQKQEQFNGEHTGLARIDQQHSRQSGPEPAEERIKPTLTARRQAGQSWKPAQRHDE